MTNYEMIVLDLDGTLTNRDKVITPRTKQALMSAQEQGKIVVLASGRPTAGVEPLAKELELERFGSYILSYNGGMIINCRTGEVVFASQIPLAANERIIGLAEEHRVDILTYEGDRIITNNDQCPYAVKESNINHLPLVQVAPGVISGDGVIHGQHIRLPVVLGHDDQFAAIELLVAEIDNFRVAAVVLS